MSIRMEERFEHATAAARAYLEAKGESTEPIEDYELADLVADVFHLAWSLGFDLDLLTARARAHFEAEQEEARQ